MTERYGEYELLATFARGGMAEVFLGRRLGVEGFAREVVVKRMLPKLAADEACVRMFLDEARLTAGLNHPNIAQILDLGRVDDTYFIAMELVDGPDLKSLFKLSIKRDLPIPAELSAHVVARVADGLQYAHDKADPATDEPLKIVHRDVNHANILLSRHGGVKLVDFGVAHAEQRSVVTDVGGLKGKMGYISPEQCLGEPFDRRADIFALGVVLHELLTRKPLFYRKSDLQTLENIVYTEAPPPSTIADGLDERIDAIVLRALSKNPDDRYSDAAQMAHELDAWCRQRHDGNLRAEVARFVTEHALHLCPTRKVPKSTRTSRSSIKRFTTGDFSRSSGGFSTGSSARRLQGVAGPTTSRDNPLLGKKRRDEARSNLPGEWGTFIGHEADLARIAAHFAADARLLTLFGAAGVGKSRVALQHARRHLKAFPESTAWWCDCGQADGVDGAIAAMATALGVPLVGAATRAAAVEQLGHALKGRGRCLVVLDDFDHLVQHAEETVDAWLAMAPQARLLVTSRALLRSPAESALEIQPLGLPAGDRRRAGDAESEAERFFVARARSVRPDFAPTEDEQRAIAEIVRRLDGIPLAIELAAARVSVLGPVELLERLSERFAVLRQGGSGADKRQALSTAIDWSWTTLSESEQLALVQATVFRGGCSLASAEAVLQLSGAALVLDVVQALRDRSMLRVVGAENRRFSLFESIREFALHKAGDAKVLQAAQRRHEAHFLEVGERWAAAVHTHDGARAREQLAAELDNLTVAHERALARRPLQARDVDAALRLALVSFPLLIERGPVALLWRLLGEALEAAGTVPSAPRWLGLALTAYGEVLARTGEPRQGLQMAQEALRVGRRAQDNAVQAHAMIVVALCHWLTDQHDKAMAAGIQARRIGHTLKDLQLETRTLNLIGCVHFARGDRDHSAATLKACVHAAQQVGHAQMEAMAQSNVGCIHADVGDLEDAVRCFRAALSACERLRNRRGIGVNRCELAIVAQERGDFAAARRHFDKAMTDLAAVGDRQRMAYARFYRGCFELERGEHRHAASLLRTAAAFFEAGGNERFWALSAALLGYLLATAGSGDDARSLFERASGIAQRLDDPPLVVVVEAMRGAANAVSAIRHRSADPGESLAAARAAIDRAKAPWPASERHPEGRAAPVRWSKEARFAVRILERLLPATGAES